MGNFVAVEMKGTATLKEAADDFESLRKFQKALRYRLIIFSQRRLVKNIRGPLSNGDCASDGMLLYSI